MQYEYFVNLPKLVSLVIGRAKTLPALPMAPASYDNFSPTTATDEKVRFLARRKVATGQHSCTDFLSSLLKHRCPDHLSFETPIFSCACEKAIRLAKHWGRHFFAHPLFHRTSSFVGLSNSLLSDWLLRTWSFPRGSMQGCRQSMQLSHSCLCCLNAQTLLAPAPLAPALLAPALLAPALIKLLHKQSHSQTP